MPDEVNYQAVSPDPSRACRNCKHFEASAEDATIGGCFGHEVSAEGTCNFFEAED